MAENAEKKVKVTKVQYMEKIREVIEASDMEDKAGALEFIDAQITQLENKAAAAKARAAKKSEEGDELRNAVQAVLTEEFQTGDEILEQVEAMGRFEELTKAKVTARLTQLIKMEMAEKDMIKVEDSKRKVTGYRAI